jgi:uncharacterized protein
MAAGLPDLVDCSHLAAEAAVLERVYELSDMSRLQDLLADARGTVVARFAFAKLASGRAGAKISVRATPHLICQRCLQGFALPVSGGSEVEFTHDEAGDAGPGREFYRIDDERVALSDLAEEELLLALPVAPKCSTPMTCGKAPVEAGGVTAEETEMRRPFRALQDLLKKT